MNDWRTRHSLVFDKYHKYLDEFPSKVSNFGFIDCSPASFYFIFDPPYQPLLLGALYSISRGTTMLTKAITLLLSSLGLSTTVTALGQASVADPSARLQQTGITVINTTGHIITMSCMDPKETTSCDDTKQITSYLADIAPKQQGTSFITHGKVVTFSVLLADKYQVIYELTPGSNLEHTRRIIIEEKGTEIFVQESIQGNQSKQASPSSQNVSKEVFNESRVQEPTKGNLGTQGNQSPRMVSKEVFNEVKAAK